MGIMRRLSRAKKTDYCWQQEFLAALDQENVTQVQNLLINNRAEIDLESLNEQGISALHLCTLSHNVTMLRVLVNFDADINARDKHGWTCLHAASALGYTDIIKFLLRHGCDHTLASVAGETAKDVAKSKDIKQLLKRNTKKAQKREVPRDNSFESFASCSSKCSSVDDMELRTG